MVILIIIYKTNKYQDCPITEGLKTDLFHKKVYNLILNLQIQTSVSRQHLAGPLIPAL